MAGRSFRLNPKQIQSVGRLPSRGRNRSRPKLTTRPSDIIKYRYESKTLRRRRRRHFLRPSFCPLQSQAINRGLYKHRSFPLPSRHPPIIFACPIYKQSRHGIEFRINSDLFRRIILFVVRAFVCKAVSSRLGLIGDRGRDRGEEGWTIEKEGKREGRSNGGRVMGVHR